MSRAITITRSPQNRYRLAIAAAIAAMAAMAALTPLAAQPYGAGAAGAPEGLGAERYGYFRTLEGSALLTTVEEEVEPIEIEINYPVLTGDSVWVESGSRLEIELADGTVLRLDAGTEVMFAALAGSPDSAEDAATHLRLLSGELQIYVPEIAIEIRPVLIESENSEIYLLAAGDYWVGSGRTRDETFVVVRSGLAEAVTKRGSVIARDGEEIRIAGRYAPYSEVRVASRERDIELWALALEEQAAGGALEEVDPRLRYAAAPLRDGGHWVWVDGRRAWRPTVRVGWRPYLDGRWIYTPSGLTWVAFEPWGWVTAHYGSWSYVSRLGWHWFPGSYYSPAWVHWYWGPTHVAWIPSGYYSRYHRIHFGLDFRFGVYGWAGGSWDYFSDWTFCDARYFGRRGGRNYWRSGRELARGRRVLAVPRGVITTDTRRLRPETWGRPGEVFRELEQAHRTRPGTIGARAVPNKPMPDVTEFVARSTRVQLKPQELERASGSSTSAADGRPMLRPVLHRDGAETQRAERTSVRGERAGEGGRGVFDRGAGLGGERGTVRSETTGETAERGAGRTSEPNSGRSVTTKPRRDGVGTSDSGGAAGTPAEEPSSLRSRLQRLREDRASALERLRRGEPADATPRSTPGEASEPRSLSGREAEAPSRWDEIRARLERGRSERAGETSGGASRDESAGSREAVPPARRVVESGRSRSRSSASGESTSRGSESARSAPSRGGESSSTRSSSGSRSSRSSASSSSGSQRSSSGSSARSRSSSGSSKQPAKPSRRAAPKKKD